MPLEDYKTASNLMAKLATNVFEKIVDISVKTSTDEHKLLDAYITAMCLSERKVSHASLNLIKKASMK